MQVDDDEPGAAASMSCSAETSASDSEDIDMVEPGST